jgi:NAD(P)-dependent dehydrogenase (short-subunit alcohol dehydrogenase family)
MFDLSEKVAVVTGASRGVGKGTAMALADNGAFVYLVSRSLDQTNAGDGMPGTLHDVLAEFEARGGKGAAVSRDLRDDRQVEELFDQVQQDHGRLDILVNASWAGYENMVEDGVYTWEEPFWRQPVRRWDDMFQSGLRAAYITSQRAAGLMANAGSGLIVNISFWAAQKYMGNVAYGAAKAATDRMTADMAHELRSHDVAVVSLYPGLVRTERIMFAAEMGAPLDLGNSESPQFIGRAVAALSVDPDIMVKSGQVLIAATLAQEYGFQDIDGKQPMPLTLEQA